MFAINNAASTLGDRLTPFKFFVDRGAHPRLPLSAPPGTCGLQPWGRVAALSSFARRMREMDQTVHELLAVAQHKCKAN